MWEGIAPVNGEYAPVIYEGDPAAVVSVVNAGPGVVRLEGWDKRRPTEKAEADIAIELRAGNFRSVRAQLIRCRIRDGEFAAVGWRIVV